MMRLLAVFTLALVLVSCTSSSKVTTPAATSSPPTTVEVPTTVTIPSTTTTVAPTKADWLHKHIGDISDSSDRFRALVSSFDMTDEADAPLREATCNLFIHQVDFDTQAGPIPDARSQKQWAVMVGSMARGYRACKATPRQIPASTQDQIRRDLDVFDAAHSELAAALSA